MGTLRIISMKPGLLCLSSLPVSHALLIPEVWLLLLPVHWHCASQGYQQPINCWTKWHFPSSFPLSPFQYETFQVVFSQRNSLFLLLRCYSFLVFPPLPDYSSGSSPSPDFSHSLRPSALFCLGSSFGDLAHP